MGANLKPVLGFDGLLKVLDQALVQVHAGAAALADEVMVVLPGLDNLVPLLAVAQVHRLDKPHAHERFQRAIDGGQPRRLRLSLAQHAMNILGAGQLPGLLQHRQHPTATPGQFPLTGAGPSGSSGRAHSTSNSILTRRVDSTGSPFSVAGRNFHCFSALSAAWSSCSSPQELMSLTVAFPCGSIMNLAMQHDLKQWSCISAGISGCGAARISAAR